MLLRGFWSSSLFFAAAKAQVTVYGQIPLAHATTATGSNAAIPTRVLLPAYDETILIPPPLPEFPAPNSFTLSLPASGENVNGLSIPQIGSFYGFSIEMSVINQLRELSCTFISSCLLTNDNQLGRTRQSARELFELALTSFQHSHPDSVPQSNV
jgi:hypothetical protein